MPLPIPELQKAIHENARAHGWWEVPSRPAELLCLVHAEVSEALECIREGQMVTTFGVGGKPEGYPTELADIVIRVLDIAEAAGIDLEAEIIRKHEFNKTRPYRHGGKVL